MFGVLFKYVEVQIFNTSHMKKLTLIAIKVLPMLLLTLLFVNEIFILDRYVYSIINVLQVIIFVTFMFILSSVFSFCIYHKVIIAYLALWYTFKSINWMFYQFHWIINFYSIIFMFLTFIVLVIILWTYLKYGNRKNQKRNDI